MSKPEDHYFKSDYQHAPRMRPYGERTGAVDERFSGDDRRRYDFNPRYPGTMGWDAQKARQARRDRRIMLRVQRRRARAEAQQEIQRQVEEEA